MGGRTGHVFDEVPRTWNVPVPVDHGLDIAESLSWIDVTKVDTYQLDGWYVRWSTGERIPIYLFKGSS